MITLENRKIRIAILDLNAGYPNQGMRCIRQIVLDWAKGNQLEIEKEEFDVRANGVLPDTGFDMYISSGGPGDPLTSRFEDWDIAWCKWVDDLIRYNSNPDNLEKKHVFFICHSFQLAARHLNAGLVYKRRSTSFGVFPVHMLEAGREESIFNGLRDPFYAVDSRDFQVIQPNHRLIRDMGGAILCIEKNRPHVPYERAVMGIRFNEYMVGTQFHPEADAEGMSLYLQTEDKKKTIIDNHGEEKYYSMIHQLGDPDKIVWTYAHILPNFLNKAMAQLAVHAEEVV